MRFVRQLDDDEVCVLEAMRRTAVGQVSQRAHMVLLSNRHYCIAEIARVFDASENTVRQWIERHERDGVDCLDDRPRSGRLPSTRTSSSLPPSLGTRLPSGLQLACGRQPCDLRGRKRDPFASDLEIRVDASGQATPPSHSRHQPEEKRIRRIGHPHRCIHTPHLRQEESR